MSNTTAAPIIKNDDTIIISDQTPTSSMAYSLLMTGFTQPDSMPATMAAWRFQVKNQREKQGQNV